MAFLKCRVSAAKQGIPRVNGGNPIVACSLLVTFEMKTETEAPNENRDPITGEPGSHPVGTGVGSLAGAATGAAVGAIGGPIGMAIGGAIGAIAGATAGHGVAEELEPTTEDAKWEAEWENTYHLQPYYISPYEYADYSPAYMMGYESPSRYPGLSFEESERDLASRWEEHRGMSRLQWEHARPAVRDGWHRSECATPGTTERDAR